MILATPTAKSNKGWTRWVHSFLLVMAGIALLTSLLFPMWRITLDAPQYPEGMGMLIWPSTITGESPNDLDIINELNHYIGMKKIIPASIPELKFIQPIIIFFGAMCLLAAIWPNIWTTAILLGGLATTGIVGLIDFWYWEYDYGHNLNPMAAIKVPGMSYQPPLLGEAKLLNFLSTSWPSFGGYFLFTAGGLLAISLALFLVKKFNGFSRQKKFGVLASVLLFGLGIIGCQQSGPTPILWGEDTCHFCKMSLVEKGFACERINSKGKVYIFDSIECLLADLKAKPFRIGEHIYVSDWSRSNAPMLDATLATFLSGGTISSPMGKALASFGLKDSALAFQNRVGGKIVAWERLPSL